MAHSVLSIARCNHNKESLAIGCEFCAVVLSTENARPSMSTRQERKRCCASSDVRPSVAFCSGTQSIFRPQRSAAIRRGLSTVAELPISPLTEARSAAIGPMSGE